MNTKVCVECLKEKSLDLFHKRTKSKDGHTFKCKSCISKYGKLHRKQQNITRQKWVAIKRHENLDKERASLTIHSHKHKGIAINISLEDLTLLFYNSKYCPICGDLYDSERDSSQKSLDRIANEMEINANNIWIICKRCNIMKGTMTMDEFKLHCKKVIR